MRIDWDEFERTRGGDVERTDQEHPELAYRRGVQQGAYFVLEAARAACPGQGGTAAASCCRLGDKVRD